MHFWDPELYRCSSENESQGLQEARLVGCSCCLRPPFAPLFLSECPASRFSTHFQGLSRHLRRLPRSLPTVCRTRLGTRGPAGGRGVFPAAHICC